MKTKRIKWFLTGMAAILLSFGLVLSGCPTPVEYEGDRGVNTPTITIAGKAQVGQKLTATVTGGSGAPDILWQWTDDVDEEGTPIRDAKGNKYTLTPAEEGRYVQAYISGTSVYSNSIGPVKAVPSGGGSVPGGDNTDNGTPGDGEGNPDDGEGTPGGGSVPGGDNTDNGTPGDSESTPGDGEGNPDDGEGTPGGDNTDNGTPGNGEGALGDGEGNPDDGEGTPGGDNTDNGTPGDGENTPGNGEGAPGDSENTPGNGEGAPGDSENTPGNGEGAPSDSEGNPGGNGNSNAPPVENPLGGSVTISGIPRVWETLTADTSALNGSGTFIYKWQRFDDAGYEGIPGANFKTYTLTQADTAKQIRVEVSCEGYKGERVSDPVGPVVSLPLEGSVAISGRGPPRVGQTLTAVEVEEIGGNGAITYTWQRSNKSSGPWADIISGGEEARTYRLVQEDQGKYIRVAVGREGYKDVIYSDTKGPVSPPLAWELGDENVFADFNAVPGIYAAGYGNGEFLVGPSVFQTTASSADGAHWIIKDDDFTGPMALVRHIVYGNGMFVAGAEFNHPFNNYAFYSTDNGKTWQTGDTEGIFDVMHSDTIRGMAYGSANGDGTFVAVGGNPSTSTDKAKAMYSKDGKKWTGTNLGLGNVMNRAVAYGGGTFVAMNGEGKAAYSTDGVNWTPASSSVLDPGNGEIGIAYDAGNKRFVAVADNGNAAYSDDNGKTWTPVNDKNLKLIKAFSDIDWGGGYFLAGGYNSNDEKGKGKLVYSADGITWHVTGDNYSEEITYSGKTRREEYIRPNLYVVYGNGNFLVTGDSAIMYSYPME